MPVQPPTQPVSVDQEEAPGDTRLLALSADDLSALPAKLIWTLVGYFRAAGAYEHARRVLDHAEQRSGESIRLIEERARLSYAQGDLDTAHQHLQYRIEVAPSASAQVALARFYLETGDLESAQQISDNLSRINGDLVTVSTLAADVANAIGDADIAKEYYLTAAGARPEHPAALLSLTQLSVDEGNDEAAATFFHRALLNLGEQASAFQCATAAGIAEALGQLEKASELRVRAAKIETERTEALVAEVLANLPDLNPELHDLSDVARAKAAPTPKATPVPPVEEPIEPAPATVAWDATRPDVDLDPRVLTTLQRDFGHTALRPGQAAVIEKVLADRDTLAIMPTGAGKSLTFQLPAMLRDGTTLVISPLIALMKDQVESLPPPVRDKTALINSTLSIEEMRARFDDLRAGRLKLVYVAPERLRDHAFLRSLRAAGVSLVVIDEAHCISMWGHDFRPDYLFIPKALPELGDPTVLAITATATPPMANQIGVGLGRDLERLRISVFRPNLYYEVFQPNNREEKVKTVIDVCRREQGTGIVYVGSRKDAEMIAALLRDKGIAAIPYHAGLAPDVRAQNQERFMRGQVRVVVATVAFGMGVDKADVRFIVHLSPPASLEAYAQESGRAGRDGKRSRCVLLASPTDESNLKRMARRDEIDLDALRRVYAMIKRSANGNWAILNRDSLLPTTSDDGEEEVDPRIALGILDQAGLLVRHPDAPATYNLRMWSHEDSDAPDEITASAEDEAIWQRFLDLIGPDARNRSSLYIRTADICSSLDLTPVELDRLLNGRSGLYVREGQRGVCLQLLPISGDATATLRTILDRAKSDAERRIRQVMAYVRGNRCRHVALAAHLGEQLDPCGTSCDICKNSEGRQIRTALASTRESPPTKTAITAQDVFEVLEGVRTLPFSMGKPGLVKLLIGSIESRVREDRSPAFGKLEGLSKGKVGLLIDRLVDEGYLNRDMNHEFKLISLTRKGADATPEDLEEFATPVKATPPSRSEQSKASATASTKIDLSDAELNDDDRQLLQELIAWRRAKATEESVPPYIVAPNTALRNLALVRPTTTAMLTAIPGFGPVKVEKYGAELLQLIARLTVQS